ASPVSASVTTPETDRSWASRMPQDNNNDKLKSRYFFILLHFEIFYDFNQLIRRVITLNSQENFAQFSPILM
ncbi:MAG: hypothetical protein NXI20_18195, partial [bacterium]|nr:hypothetical protein [bacterium]